LTASPPPFKMPPPKKGREVIVLDQDPTTAPGGRDALMERIRELEASERKYRHLFERSPAMVYLTDIDGVILDINEGGVEMLGYERREEVIGLTAARSLYVDPADRLRFQEQISKTGSVRGFETRMRRRDGRIIDVSITSALRFDDDGAVAGYEGFVLDITDKQQTRRALQESEEKYRTVAENTLVGICFHQDGRFRYVNRRLAEMLGYDSPDELLGEPFWEVIHPDDREMVRLRGLRRQRGQFHPEQYPFRALRKDGSVLWAELWASPALYRGRAAVVTMIVDITANRQAEEEIRHLSRRLIEVSEEEKKNLAADLHDDLGQNLASLHFGLEALELSLPPEAAESRERCRALIGQVERMAEQVRTTISRLRPDLLDHLGLIPAMEWYVQEYLRNRPGLEVEFQAAGFKKRLPLQMETVLYRILQECLTNISKHARARKVKIFLTFSYPRIILTVKDDGVGYNPRAQAFPAEGGRGIGLLSMRERIASLKGVVTISSAPGKGTTIRVEIPLLEEEA